jgi:hypothetical protein
LWLIGRPGATRHCAGRYRADGPELALEDRGTCRQAGSLVACRPEPGRIGWLFERLRSVLYKPEDGLLMSASPESDYEAPFMPATNAQTLKFDRGSGKQDADEVHVRFVAVPITGAGA